MTWQRSATACSRRARSVRSRSRRWSGPWARRPPVRPMVVPSSGPMTPPGGRSGPRWPMPAGILRHDPGTRMGSVEDLHQFRVGVRRLRSDLRTLEPLLERSWAQARCRPQVTGRPAGGRPRPRRPDGSHGPGARRPGDGPAADGRRSPAAPHDGPGGSPRRASVRSVCAAPRAPRGAGPRSRAEPGRADAHGEALPTLAATAWRRLERADGLTRHRPMASCTGSGLLPTSAVRRRNGGARPGARACRGCAALRRRSRRVPGPSGPPPGRGGSRG